MAASGASAIAKARLARQAAKGEERRKQQEQKRKVAGLPDVAATSKIPCREVGRERALGRGWEVHAPMVRWAAARQWQARYRSRRAWLCSTRVAAPLHGCSNGSFRINLHDACSRPINLMVAFLVTRYYRINTTHQWQRSTMVFYLLGVILDSTFNWTLWRTP